MYSRCPLCDTSSCRGCVIPDDEEFMPAPSSLTAIIIEWDVRWVDQTMLECVDRSVLLDAQHEMHRHEPAATLASCFDAFTTPETLSAAEQWYCSTCRDFRCATKKLDLYRLPPILICHLKRFRYTHETRSKIETVVQYPIHGWEVETGVKEEKMVYDLYAVVHHMGGTDGGEHDAR